MVLCTFAYVDLIEKMQENYSIIVDSFSSNVEKNIYMLPSLSAVNDLNLTLLRSLDVTGLQMSANVLLRLITKTDLRR